MGAGVSYLKCLYRKNMSKRIVVLRLIGGLGNQLFQLQYAHKFIERYGGELKIDDSFLAASKKTHEKIAVQDLVKNYRFTRLSLFDLNVKRIIEKIYHKINIPLPKIFEHEFIFENSKIKVRTQKRLIIDGFWQDKKYLNNCFLEKLKAKIKSKKLLENISEIDREIVCVHIRRGDYLSNRNFCLRQQSVLEIDYYKNAFKFIEKNNIVRKYHVYTDDDEWARNAFINSPNVDVIDTVNDEPFKVILKMSCYSVYVIANSTLSWWAAVISPATKKLVVLPKLWFANEPSKKFQLEKWHEI